MQSKYFTLVLSLDFFCISWSTHHHRHMWDTSGYVHIVYILHQRIQSHAMLLSWRKAKDYISRTLLHSHMIRALALCKRPIEWTNERNRRKMVSQTRLNSRTTKFHHAHAHSHSHTYMTELQSGQWFAYSLTTGTINLSLCTKHTHNNFSVANLSYNHLTITMNGQYLLIVIVIIIRISSSNKFDENCCVIFGVN